MLVFQLVITTPSLTHQLKVETQRTLILELGTNQVFQYSMNNRAAQIGITNRHH